MIDVHDIRISADVPGLYLRYMVEVRLIDKESEIIKTDYGFVYSYDKVFAVASNSMNYLLKKTGNRITEIICE